MKRLKGTTLRNQRGRGQQKQELESLTPQQGEKLVSNIYLITDMINRMDLPTAYVFLQSLPSSVPKFLLMKNRIIADNQSKAVILPLDSWEEYLRNDADKLEQQLTKLVKINDPRLSRERYLMTFGSEGNLENQQLLIGTPASMLTQCDGYFYMRIGQYLDQMTIIGDPHKRRVWCLITIYHEDSGLGFDVLLEENIDNDIDCLVFADNEDDAKEFIKNSEWVTQRLEKHHYHEDQEEEEEEIQTYPSYEEYISDEQMIGGLVEIDPAYATIIRSVVRKTLMPEVHQTLPKTHPPQTPDIHRSPQNIHPPQTPEVHQIPQKSHPPQTPDVYRPPQKPQKREAPVIERDLSRCQCLLKSGTNEGKQCQNPKKYPLGNPQYCGIHNPCSKPII